MNKYININEEYLKFPSKEMIKLLNFNKPIKYIFGKNGSGKTTILNFINDSLNNEYEIFLFNEKYVYQNIYTNELSKDANSIECLSSNESKKNTYEIFFGKKLKDIMDETNDLNKQLSIVKNDVLSISKLTSISINFSEFVVEKWNTKIKNEILFSKTTFKLIKNITTETINDFILNDKNKLIANDIELKNGAERIKLISLIKIINNKILNFNTDVCKFNNLKHKNNIEQKIWTLHNFAINNCVLEDKTIHFMSKQYTENEIKKYFKTIESERNKILSSIKHCNKEIENECYKLNEYIDTINIKNSLDIIELKKLANILLEFSKNYKYYSDELSVCSELKVLVDHCREKIEEEIKNILELKWFYLFNNPLDIREKIMKIVNLDNKISDLNVSRQEQEKDINDKFIETMNKHLFSLNNSHYMKLTCKFSNHNKTPRVELNIENKSLTYLSAGEKTSLALSYFLTHIEMNYTFISNGFLILIDDPFDSMDHFKYDRWPAINMGVSKPGMGYFIKHIEKHIGKKGIYIFSTHNVCVMSSLIHNGLENNEYLDMETKSFKKIKPWFLENINVFELKKDIQNNANLKEMFIPFYFPMEAKLIENIILLINDLLLSFSEDKCYLFRFSSLILTKLLDRVNSENRTIYKSFNLDFFENINNEKYEEIFIKNIFKIDCFKSGNLITDNEIRNISNFLVKNKIKKFEEFDKNIFDNKYTFLIEYFNSMIDNYNVVISDILTNNDIDKKKRLRHKNNFHFSPIGFIIEE